MKEALVIDLGRTKYADAWRLQQQVFAARRDGRIGDVVLFTEHDHVYTLGKAADENHLLAGNEELSANGVDVFHIDRGGDVTYHGPGQIVGYPIIDLNDHYCDVHRYLRDIEEVIIRALREFGVEGRRDPEFTGVWVKNDKIAAIGIKVSRWVTMHGFALNVNTDLTYFDRIIPCGIFHKGVVSLQQCLGGTADMHGMRDRLTDHFSHIFGVGIKQIPREELDHMLHHHEAIAEEM